MVERLAEHSFDGEVVAVSAFTQDVRLDSGMVADYVAKPIDREEFIDTLEEHV